MAAPKTVTDWVTATTHSVRRDPLDHSWLAGSGPLLALALIFTAIPSLPGVAASPIGPPRRVVFHSARTRTVRECKPRPTPRLQRVVHRVVFSAPLEFEAVAGIAVSQESSDCGASQRSREGAHSPRPRLYCDLPVSQFDRTPEPAVQARVVPCGVVLVRRLGVDVSV